MSSEVHHLRIGAFDCLAIGDGTHTYAPPAFPPPATFLFNNAPAAELEKTVRERYGRPEAWTEWISPYISLLVNTGRQRVLVDTGAHDLGPHTGRLVPNLQAEGIAPEDIDLVILSHCHPDHINGLTLDGGRLVFPNARYAMWKGEWDFWTSGEAEAQLSDHIRDTLLGFVRKNLPPIEGRLELLEREGEILPGIQAISAPGHTPGHMGLVISSEGDQLLYIADTVVHPIHVEHPEWCAVVDFDHDQVAATRRRLFARAVAEQSLVLAYHFPFPGLGHVVQNGEAWAWRPIRR